jgi:hypothetical protein
LFEVRVAHGDAAQRPGNYERRGATMAEFDNESTSSSDDEVEFDVEQFSIAGHSFDLTTVAFMPITKLLKVCVSSVSSLDACRNAGLTISHLACAFSFHARRLLS